MKHTWLRFGMILGLVGALAVFSGCNTTAGFGKDLEAAGGSIEKAADGDD